jgi:glycosyltransferase involved in cell wall biosynthesis
MKHIVYLHQYFATREGVTGTRSYEFARRWVQAGNQVTVITSTAQLTAAECAGATKSSLLARELMIDGIRILALELPYRQTMSYVRRIWSFCSFSLFATALLLRLEDVRAVYATSTPLTIVVPALVRKICRGTPYVFEVRDLWPELPIAIGTIRSRAAGAILRWLERRAYHSAAGIVALSPDMKALIDRTTLDPPKTIVVPNCADIDIFRPLEPREIERVRHRLGWDGRFVIIHTGAMGRINALDRVLDLAGRLRHKPRVLFVLLGSGSEKPRLQKLAAEQELANVSFVDALPKQQLAPLLAAADAGFVSIAKITQLEYNSANKFFDYLACGLPVLLNYGGWQKQVLEQHQAGFGCDSFDDAQCLRNILRLLEDESLCVSMGRNARVLSERMFDRTLLAGQTLAFIDTCLESRSAPRL